MTELDYARQIVREASAPTVLELGAHHGHETARIWAAMRGRGRYVAVEADPENFGILRQNLKHTGVELIHAAVVGEIPPEGVLPFRRSRGGSGSGSIRAPKEHLAHFPAITFGEVVEVPAVTLDALAASLDVVDLIWADLQGAERDMIFGGHRTLARTRWMVIEAERVEMYEGQATRDELLALLSGWDVVEVWEQDANLLMRNTACA